MAVTDPAADLIGTEITLGDKTWTIKESWGLNKQYLWLEREEDGHTYAIIRRTGDVRQHLATL